MIGGESRKREREAGERWEIGEVKGKGGERRDRER